MIDFQALDNVRSLDCKNSLSLRMICLFKTRASNSPKDTDNKKKSKFSN